MKLKEISEQATPRLGARKRIENLIAAWSRRANITRANFTINSDLSVDVDGNVDIEPLDTITATSQRISLPVHFNKVSGEFAAIRCKLESLEGLPKEVGGSVHLYQNRFDFNELKHLPKHIRKVLTLYDNPNLTSLHNIHKYLREMGGTLYIPNTLKSNLLGVFMIKGIYAIQISGNEGGDAPMDLVQAVVIINTHLKKSPRDVHKCQEDLIESGLGALAKL